MKPEERQLALAEIAAQVAACTACPLYQGTNNPVPGDGALGADIFFIGEGPGREEDRQGLPFVGASGKYLEQLLALIGLKRQDVFIANVVKHRPPENRDPLPAEIDACRPYLDRQIDIINPIMIVTLGRFSMARYFPNAKITQIHGQPKFEDGRIYYPLFHPAAVLRNESLRPVMEEDFRRIKTLVEQAKSGVKPGDEPPPNEPPKQLSLF